MHDPTEDTRRALQAAINAEAAEREALEKEYGKVWNTEELRKEFLVLGFAEPFVVVERCTDNAKGSLMFQHQPRYYFKFEVDK